MSEIGQTISQQVKALRFARGMTLADLASRVGTTKSYIWAIERGETRNPTIDMAVSLARALGVSFEELTGVGTAQPALHPEAMRIACEVDALLRKNAA